MQLNAGEIKFVYVLRDILILPSSIISKMEMSGFGRLGKMSLTGCYRFRSNNYCSNPEQILL
jgi:hypothetical protein